MGNPLLDISAEVDASLLEHYNLLPNNAILAGAEHMSLYVNSGACMRLGTSIFYEKIHIFLFFRHHS
jgi:hypothetical protein